MTYFFARPSIRTNQPFARRATRTHESLELRNGLRRLWVSDAENPASVDVATVASAVLADERCEAGIIEEFLVDLGNAERIHSIAWHPGGKLAVDHSSRPVLAHRLAAHHETAHVAPVGPLETDDVAGQDFGAPINFAIKLAVHIAFDRQREIGNAVLDVSPDIVLAFGRQLVEFGGFVLQAQAMGTLRSTWRSDHNFVLNTRRVRSDC